MKYFVFSDVHGFYSVFRKELRKKGFDPKNEEHILISLGDNYDRGKENYKMFKFLRKMWKKKRIILIKGNHEDLFMEMMQRGYPISIDYSNKTYNTLVQFYRQYFNVVDEEDEPKDWNELYQLMKKDKFFDIIYDMKDYYETDKYVFTHGFIPIDGEYSYYYNENCSYKEDWRDSTSRQFKDARWYNGIELSMKYNIGVPNKKIIVGHYHASYGNVRKEIGMNHHPSEYKKYEFSNFDFFKPYEDNNIIAIDSCVAFTNKINILVLDD